MAVSIQVSTKTFNDLSSLVRGFGETPESVIQRLLAAYLGEEGEADDEEIHQQGRSTITKEQIAKIYELTREAFIKSSSISRASIEHIGGIVAKEEDMNEASAVMYAAAVSKLLTGKRYGPSIRQEALKYFLNNIHKDFDDGGLQKALSSLYQCIKSIEERRNIICHGLRKIHAEFLARLDNDNHEKKQS